MGTLACGQNSADKADHGRHLCSSPKTSDVHMASLLHGQLHISQVRATVLGLNTQTKHTYGAPTHHLKPMMQSICFRMSWTTHEKTTIICVASVFNAQWQRAHQVCSARAVSSIYVHFSNVFHGKEPQMSDTYHTRQVGL